MIRNRPQQPVTPEPARPITALEVTTAQRTNTKMLLALSARSGHVYEGTVPAAVVAHRRKRNKAARKARRTHRKAATR